jgi:beta-lactamase superfamily II metal-dependent hydrolase
MSGEVAYEIDFLPVGSGDKSGDAIACRWKEGDAYKVLVYDGGNKESGQALVNHINKYYGTNRVDYVVNSHPDGDHASGLQIVLEQMDVGQLWMHRPWLYSSVIRDYFHDGRITDNSLKERLQAKMAAAYKLEEIALAKRISLSEPFQGSQIGPFTVLSPDKDWYVHELIQAFEKSPEQKTTSVMDMAMEKLAEAARKLIDLVAESWSSESLRDNVKTSAENDSSAILLAHFGGRGVLFTGDAGVKALAKAVMHAILTGHNLPESLSFIQVPHHGSRNNVSPKVLDLIVGPIKAVQDENYTKTAYVSASKGSTTHPRRMVVNAFLRRGARVIATQGGTKWHSYNTPPRSDFSSVSSMQFFNEVESWD